MAVRLKSNITNHYQGLIKHLDVRAFPEPTIDLDEVDLGNPYYLFVIM